MYNFIRTQANYLKRTQTSLTFGDELSHCVSCNVRPFHIYVVTSWLTFKHGTAPVAFRAPATMSDLKYLFKYLQNFIRTHPIFYQLLDRRASNKQFVTFYICIMI